MKQLQTTQFLKLILQCVVKKKLVTLRSDWQYHGKGVRVIGGEGEGDKRAQKSQSQNKVVMGTVVQHGEYSQ